MEELSPRRRMLCVLHLSVCAACQSACAKCPQRLQVTFWLTQREQVACRCAQRQFNTPRVTPPPRSTRRKWLCRLSGQAGPLSTRSRPEPIPPSPLNASWVCGASAVSALCPPQRDPIGQCIKSASHHIIGGERRAHDEREAESVHAHEPLHPVPPKKHRAL